ncbi:hypothetical protein SALBM311S_03758 [Streptomyces alboniger]
MPPPREHPDQYAGAFGPVEVLPSVACVGVFHSTALAPDHDPILFRSALTVIWFQPTPRVPYDCDAEPTLLDLAWGIWPGTARSSPSRIAPSEIPFPGIGPVCQGRSVTVSRSDLLRRQFDLTWSLFEYHLDRLEPEDFLWEPAPHCWTVHRTVEGTWVPDWAETEPDPVPVPTVGWLSWHIGWWWSVTLDHLEGRPPRDRTDVTWPGPGKPTVDWLRDLRSAWLTARPFAGAS